MFEIRQDELTGAQARALVAQHLGGMRANSPPKAVFALDISGLQAPNVTVWTAWREDRIAGMGALKVLEAGAGELKSMRTHPDFLRQGVGTAILQRIIAEARALGMVRLSLETGKGEAFEPALMLYRRFGFKDGLAFADYADNGFSQFLHLTL